MAPEQRRQWVLLAYRLPREPSTPRIAVWRKLRRLGAAQIVDGLVALPATARTREQLGWVANDVLDAGGEASVWVGRLETHRYERELTARMAADVREAYRRLTTEAEAVAGEPDAERRRTLARLRRELRRIAERDHFDLDDAERASRALERLGRRTVGA